ncbi:protein kinase domain-containing protein [Streptomyces sp. L7]
MLPLLAADPDADAPWLATAYAPGPTLAQYLAAHGPLADGLLYAFAAGTAQAIAAIHSAGVVHRDVKPQNVLLTPAGPRMLDFGIAHAADGTSVTRTGVLTGTPGWISPEHCRSGVTASEGDLFAWGGLVAYAATGRLPFGTGAPEAVAYRVTSGRPDLDGIPEALKELLERALAKEPAERPAAAEAVDRCVQLLSAACTQVLDGRRTVEAGNNPTLIGDLVTAQWSVPAVDDPSWPNSASGPQSSSRRRAMVAVLVTAAVVGASVGGALAFRHDDPQTSASAGSTVTTDAKDAVGTHASDAATDGTASAGAGVAGQAAADPRTIPVPVDPLAGVAAPPSPAPTTGPSPFPVSGAGAGTPSTRRSRGQRPPSVIG